jgi:lipoprotein-anchoring transpeptidase ErfK/SrfK
MIRFVRRNSLPRAASIKQLLSQPALAAGLALLLASSAPAGAGFFDFPNQPRYANPNVEPPRAAKPDRKPHREARRHDGKATREQPPAEGPFQIVVDIAKQQVALYGQDGFIVRAGISTGMPGHPTPMGVFTVISKAKWHQSNIYSGAPMPYMQRITWSGIAMHAGPRPGYPASHGCIRLPEDFAIRLFHTTKVGARVIVTREPAAPVEFAHPKLFVPTKLAEKTLAFAAETTKAVSGADAPGAARPAAATTTDVTSIMAVPPLEQKPASGPPRAISVFVSLKQSRVFVRQGFEALFDLPVTIAEPERPLGTHVFTAMALKDDGKAMRWTAVSIASGHRHRVSHADKRHHGRKTAEADEAQPVASTAAAALDRITLPGEAIERISALLLPGSSLIVSDNALSDETDADTDFIVLTP